jgi:outer membrane lipopolysaccharide assembly protein LptE/RlpB
MRGTESNMAHFDNMYISAPDSHSELVKTLKRKLQAGGVTLMKNATTANYSLVIIEQDSDSRVASISSSARISERYLIETAEFLVLDKEGIRVIPSTLVTIERAHEYDETNVLATDDETRLLRREMHADLARQIYNRLRHIRKPAPASDASTD